MIQTDAGEGNSLYAVQESKATSYLSLAFIIRKSVDVCVDRSLPHTVASRGLRRNISSCLLLVEIEVHAPDQEDHMQKIFPLVKCERCNGGAKEQGWCGDCQDCEVGVQRSEISADGVSNANLQLQASSHY